MRSRLLDDLQQRCSGLVGEGLFKTERLISSPQSAHIRLADGSSVLNLCANNYLGLADHPDVIASAHRALDRYGYGMASVRFICGTQTVHKELEARLSAFLGTDDTILYSSCFDANGGLFETILDEQDAVISDALNHASIIDGIRLCRAQRLRYDNNDMHQLEATPAGGRRRPLPADRHRWRVLDGWRVRQPPGHLRSRRAVRRAGDGRRLPRRRVRRRARPRHPRAHRRDGSRRHHHRHVGQGARWCFRRVHVGSPGDRSTGCGNARGPTCSPTASLPSSPGRASACSTCWKPAASCAVGFNATPLAFARRWPTPGSRWRAPGTRSSRSCSATPVAGEMAERLLHEGIYVIAFSFPVVPQGKARIRTQMSAAHSDADIDQAIDAFVRVGKAMGVVP